jgi:hypothetical protein
VPAVAPAALCLILAAFGARTWTRNVDWRDDVTLWASAVRAAPRSFKTHQGLADALYESDPGHPDLNRVIEEADRSVAILDALPDAVNVPGSYRRAAGYYLEHGDLLRDSGTRDAVSESKAAYERSVVLTRRHLAIVDAQRATTFTTSSGVSAQHKDGTRELSDAYVMLSTGYARLQDRDKAIEAARQAHVLQPLNSIPYRVIAAALIDGMRYDEAAVWLLAGFMVSGDPELSQATIDLYRAGGDPKGCALKTGAQGFVLDPSCETVRRHLCAATVQAVQIQRASGRGEFARQLEETARQNYGCR